jgi:rubrerythrin
MFMRSSLNGMLMMISHLFGGQELSHHSLPRAPKPETPMTAWVCQNCGTIIHARQCPAECKTCGNRSNKNA